MVLLVQSLVASGSIQWCTALEHKTQHQDLADTPSDGWVSDAACMLSVGEAPHPQRE